MLIIDNSNILTFLTKSTDIPFNSSTIIRFTSSLAAVSWIKLAFVGPIIVFNADNYSSYTSKILACHLTDVYCKTDKHSLYSAKLIIVLTTIIQIYS